MRGAKKLWSPPPSRCFKVNVDGAVFQAQKAVGLGAVIRDNLGRVEAAISRRLHAPLGPLETEAKAFENGLIFAKEVGLHEVILEGDSLLVVHALQQSAPPPVTVSAIIQGILELCKQFHYVEFSHVGRIGNKPAHLLAKQGLGISDFLAWVEEYPCFIEQAFTHDVMLFS